MYQTFTFIHDWTADAAREAWMCFFSKKMCFLSGERGKSSHQLSNHGVCRQPGGGINDFSLEQWRGGKVPLLFGAKSAGLKHEALSPVQPLHLPEGAQHKPLRAQVQGKSSRSPLEVLMAERMMLLTGCGAYFSLSFLTSTRKWPEWLWLYFSSH